MDEIEVLEMRFQEIAHAPWKEELTIPGESIAEIWKP